MSSFLHQAEEEAERQDQLRRTVEKLAAANPDAQRPAAAARPENGGAGDMDADDGDEERASAGLGLSGEEAFARRARCCSDSCRSHCPGRAMEDFARYSMQEKQQHADNMAGLRQDGLLLIIC